VSHESRRLAAILLIVFPTVVFGGASLLSMLIGNVEGYQDNPMRQDLWRAGHAHAGVLLILSLVFLRYVDEAQLAGSVKRLTRLSVPIAAIMLPVAFFLSVLSPDATEPNTVIYLAYLGAVVLVAGMLSLGIGLYRASR
jgi:Ni,Fe-hydrogenase I cytochrome b subunit